MINLRQALYLRTVFSDLEYESVFSDLECESAKCILLLFISMGKNR